MELRETALLVARAAVRAGVVGGLVLAVPVLTDIDAGLVGILLVLVGGLVAGIALVNPPDSGGAYEAGAAPALSTLDPLARSDGGGSPLVGRFLFGVVLLLIGFVAVVVAG